MAENNWFNNGQEIKERAHQLSWLEFAEMETQKKIIFLNNLKTNHPFHVIFSQQFDRNILFLLCQVAEKARLINKDRKKGRKFLRSLLFGASALNFFAQPSTRTRLSFERAEKILGMDVTTIDNPNTSSEAKGESIEDTIRTFSSYFDLMTIRHPNKDMAELGAWVLNKSDRRIPIINGGSGADQHPTQALTDIYTLFKSFNGEIDGRTIIMVGDLARGRTVRSFSYLMKNFSDMKLIFVSPPHLKMEKDINSFLARHNISYWEADNLQDVVHLADVIYMTRIQDEWDEKTFIAQEKAHKPVDSKYRFKKEYLDLMQKHAVLMHPLPKRDEIEKEVGYIKDPRVVFWRQERNGMWIRVALIATIFQEQQKILDYIY